MGFGFLVILITVALVALAVVTLRHRRDRAGREEDLRPPESKREHPDGTV